MINMKQNQTIYKHPLNPIYNTHSRILILGSFPSVISREEQFYYAHPRNRFWKILYELFETTESKAIKQEKHYKIQFLEQHHIALWDIAQKCTINKSKDSTMQNVTPNNITLILSQANINAIFCNGNKTHELFWHFFNKTMQSCDKYKSIKVFSLPSSSPANAKYSLAKLIEAWSIIKNYNTPYITASLTDKQIKN